MVKKIKFALEMKGGVMVRRGIEELRDNFDLAKAVEHFTSGKLVEWLEDRFFDEEAAKIKAIAKDAPSDVIQRQLCEALGVEPPEDMDEDLDMEIVKRNNEKEDLLRQKTNDQSIIAHASQTAFNRDDLSDLWDMDEPVIYLCGDIFKINSRLTDRTYIGILGKPRIEIDVKNRDELSEKGIKFENVELPEHLQEKVKAETKPCPKCGMENPSTAKFCNECGARMDCNVTDALSTDKEWRIPKSQLKMMFVATFKEDFDDFNTLSKPKIDGNTTFLMKLKEFGEASDNLSDEQKNTAITLICGGQYTEDDLIHLRISEDLSNGWALTLNSFCFVESYSGISGIIPYEKLEIHGYGKDAEVKLADNQSLRIWDMLGGLCTAEPLAKYLTNMRNMFRKND